MTSAEKLRKTREKAGLTQTQLAARLGVKPQSYSQYERGVRCPRYETMVRIASALGVNINDIWGEDLQNEALDSSIGDALDETIAALESAASAFDKIILETCQKLSLRNKGKLLTYASDLLDAQKFAEMAPEESTSIKVSNLLK